MPGWFPLHAIVQFGATNTGIVALSVIAVGCVKVIVVFVTVQPLSSLTLNVYVPARRPLNAREVGLTVEPTIVVLV